METTSMETRQLHSSQKEALKKRIEFSGDVNELDIDEWLFHVNNLFSLMRLKDETKILETMGKLTGPALRWYQENLRSFINWNDAEKALRDRFKEFGSDSQLMQEFFHIYQEENQSVTSFYENVIHIKKPEEWLQVAREEEYIQKQIQQQSNSLYPETKNKIFFESILPTATIQPTKVLRDRQTGFGTQTSLSRRSVQPTSSNTQSSSQQPFASRHYYQQQHQQLTPSTINRTYSKQNNFSNLKQNRKNYPENKIQKSNPCLICNKNNHATTKCFYKKSNGCFKCGLSNHQVPLIDAGSAITIIHQHLLNDIPHQELIPKTINHLSANCSTLNIIGEISLEINVNGIKTTIIADVTTNLVTNLILGSDWIQANNVYFLTPEQRIMIRSRGKEVSTPSVKPYFLN
ncbi:unnamed protein product [Rotaria sp. Silwood2]|nr:unnamed protein product [Rotaria sp. Silwood2]